MWIEQTPTFVRYLFPHTVWRLPKEEKTVYLTFDDGPIPEVTPFVLDLLRERGIKATFFCVGENVMRYPELFERLKREGHQVGNHTYNHLQGFRCGWHRYIDNVAKADGFIDSVFFRPPHGQFRLSQSNTLRERYRLIFWDVITRDYNSKLSGERVLDNVRRYVRNGSIIVFHDSLKAERNLRYALPLAIDYLIAQGYRFERLTEECIDENNDNIR